MGVLSVAGGPKAATTPRLKQGASTALPARAQKASLRLAQYKAGDQPRLAGLAAVPYRAGWFEFGSGNLMLEAVSAGSLDLAYGSEVPPAFAALSGAPIRIVAVARGGVNEPVVLVPSGSSVQSIAELRGKRVGYVRATTTHCSLFRMPEEAGLSWSDIQPVNLTPADGQAAFRAGSLDAWMPGCLDAWMPGRSTATRCRWQSRPGAGAADGGGRPIRQLPLLRLAGRPGRSDPPGWGCCRAGWMSARYGTAHLTWETLGGRPDTD